MLRSIALPLVLINFTGCSSRPELPPKLADSLKQAATWELLSIDPNPTRHPADSPRELGYPVLGRLKITDEAVKEKLLAEPRQSLVNRHAAAKCFEPRHMIRVECNGETIDVLICFDCSNLTGFIDGARQREFQIAHNPKLQESLNQLLADQKIPLAP